MALTIVVVTPEATALEQTADFVVLPLFDGELGIGRGHSPLIGRLGYGELRITTGGSTQKYYVDGGFVQVAGDIVSVLTGRAVPAKNVDGAAAQRQLEAAAQKPTATDDELAIRDRLVSQARAQIRIAQKA